MTIFYDGACPFCTNYVTLLRLREAVGPVDLIDARSGDARVREVMSRYDLDAGMLVVYAGHEYFGADAVNIMALLSDSSANVLALAVNWLMKDARRARWSYPLLRELRNLSLRVRGRKKIGAEIL